MRLSEIAEYVVKKYPDCCMAANKVVDFGNRDEEYEKWVLLDELVSFFMFDKVRICGCGLPEDTYNVIRKVLTIQDAYHKDAMSYSEIQTACLEDLGLDVKSNDGNGMHQFILYILDNCGLVEHGSSIGGCWLTEEGKMCLDVLNAWYLLNESED